MAHHGAAMAPLLAWCTESAQPRRPNLRPFTCAMLTSMSTVLMGYELFIREDLGLSDAQVDLPADSRNVYMLVSILAAGRAADQLGCRGALVLANGFFLAGALCMSLGVTYAALMAARFVTGVGVGLAVVIATVYTAEVAPASTRGIMSSLLDICINVGILLGYLSNYAFAGLPVRLGWRVMYAAGVLPLALVAAAVLLAMPESPRWLAMRARDADARAVLVRTSDTVTEADLSLEEIKQAVDEAPPHPGGVWTELLVRPSATVRRALICVIVLQFFHEASGIEAIVLYSPLIIKRGGMSSTTAVLGATVAVSAVKTVSILFAALLADRLGRRPLLLASAGDVAAAMASLAAGLLWLDAATSPAARVAAVLAFVVAFSVGFGPLVPAYCAEVLPLRLRAQGSSLSTAAGRLTCGVVSMTFISLADAITMPGCFVVYAGVAVVACMFVYVRLPETRGRCLEDMEVLFAK